MTLQEIVQLARGPLTTIRGDQQTQAVFVFSRCELLLYWCDCMCSRVHARPDQEGVDREVTFKVFGGQWKSTG